MSVYFLASIKINDPLEYQKYLDGAGEVFSRFKGRYLVVEDSPEVLEGKVGEGRIVLIEFPSKADFEAWYYSGEYQDILKYRLAAAHCNSVLIEGLV